MIKKWTSFNENIRTSDDITIQDLSAFVKKIREAFVDFEDNDSIEYQFFILNRTCISNLWIPANPNIANIDNWVEKSKDLIDINLIRSYSNKIGLDVRLKLKKKTNITGLGGSILNEDGIDQLEDIITAKNRIKDHYDEVYLSFLGNSSDYVPVTFKVIYNK